MVDHRRNLHLEVAGDERLWHTRALTNEGFVARRGSRYSSGAVVAPPTTTVFSSLTTPLPLSPLPFFPPHLMFSLPFPLLPPSPPRAEPFSATADAHQIHHSPISSLTNQRPNGTAARVGGWCLGRNESYSRSTNGSRSARIPHSTHPPHRSSHRTTVSFSNPSPRALPTTPTVALAVLLDITVPFVQSGLGRHVEIVVVYFPPPPSIYRQAPGRNGRRSRASPARCRSPRVATRSSAW